MSRRAGAWGETQLGLILEDMLTPDQYEVNAQVRPNTMERVEFAILLPGRDDHGRPVKLAVDSKFPTEDYERLVQASDNADKDAVEQARAALAKRIEGFAKDIRGKYVEPPHTTDFAIMYLPTEGLFAEAIRHPGLFDRVRSQHQVIITGPTTFSAILSSLQMGFRTLAVEKRSSEVWQVLGEVKTEFGKFGDVLANVRKKLQQAGNQMDQVGVRTQAIDRKLRDVETIQVEPGNPAFEVLEALDLDDNEVA